MIDLKNLNHVEKVLRNELSLNLKTKDEIPEQFYKLCDLINRVQILIKEVEHENHNRNKQSD